MPDQQHVESEHKETGRIEAFSDGVLAIAITLLALELKVPHDTGAKDFSLGLALRDQWPMYLAFLISFFFILVMWINHHRLFTVIRRSDNNLLLLNGFLLLCICIVPFVTELVAEYLQDPGQNVAAMVYSGAFLMTSLLFNALWRYASYKNRLFDQKTDLQLVNFISRQYVFGPFLYLLTFLVATFSAPASLFMSFVIAIFFAMPQKAVRELITEAQEP